MSSCASLLVTTSASNEDVNQADSGEYKLNMFEMNYNNKLYSTFLMKFVVRVSYKLYQVYDYCIDRKVCGCSLVRYVPSPFRESRGSTGSQSTPYLVLATIFHGFKFTANDRFIDIGCGKGRVLAHLERIGFPGLLYGIELNTEVAQYAQEWASRYDNLTIMAGDAFKLDYNNYTCFFLNRPFLPPVFRQFIEKIEKELTHSITLFYWVDQQSGNLLNDRPGWILRRRDVLFKLNGFYMATSPQRYSIWTFTPQGNKEFH